MAETAVMAAISAVSTMARFPWSKLLLKNIYLRFSYYLPYLAKITVEFLNMLAISVKLKNYFRRRYTLRRRSAGPPPHPSCIPYPLYLHSTSILLSFHLHFTFISLHFTFTHLHALSFTFISFSILF